tara:strand:+ start:433 stop:1260 length:828 start_codon:yes stop_codon:yes gene_type:complete
MATGIVNPYALTSEFDVLTDVPWHTLYWGDGPLAQATFSGINGSLITSNHVPDEMGTSGDNLIPKTSSTGIRQYNNFSLMNYLGCWLAPGSYTGDYLRLSGNENAWTKGPLPGTGYDAYSVIGIFTSRQATSETTYRAFYTSLGSGSHNDGVSVGGNTRFGGVHRLSPGTAGNTATGAAAPINTIHSQRFSLNTGTSLSTLYYVNGALRVNWGAAAAATMTNVRLLGSYSNPWYGMAKAAMGLWGVVPHNGYINSEPWFSDLETWLMDTYGVAGL